MIAPIYNQFVPSSLLFRVQCPKTILENLYTFTNFHDPDLTRESMHVEALQPRTFIPRKFTSTSAAQQRHWPSSRFRRHSRDVTTSAPQSWYPRRAKCTCDHARERECCGSKREERDTMTTAANHLKADRSNIVIAAVEKSICGLHVVGH